MFGAGKYRNKNAEKEEVVFHENGKCFYQIILLFDDVDLILLKQVNLRFGYTLIKQNFHSECLMKFQLIFATFQAP